MVVSREVIVESGCTLVVVILAGSNGETESRGERLSQFGDVIGERIKGEQSELGTCGASYQRLDKGHHGRVEAGLGEDLLADGCRGNSVLVEEGVGDHTDA